MTITLRRKRVREYEFIVTDILNAEVTLTKKLVERLKADKIIGKSATIDLPDYAAIYAKPNGKYANIYLGIKEPKAAETFDDLPF